MSRGATGQRLVQLKWANTDEGEAVSAIINFTVNEGDTAANLTSATKKAVKDLEEFVARKRESMKG